MDSNEQSLQWAIRKKSIINWIVAIIVAAVYLAFSLIFHAWAYSWIIWVAYALYRLIVK